MRREDRRLSETETLAILQNGEYGVLSISAPDNSGYGIPMSYALVENAIYFHCATEGTKLDYLQQNSQVTFTVVGKTEVMPHKFGTLYESAIVSGKCIEVEGDEKYIGLLGLIEKYSADFVEAGKAYIDKLYDHTKVLKLSIDSIDGKARKPKQ